MPHYKDGTPAEVGDDVKGVPYNTDGREIVGKLVQITEECESCNCIVAFIEPTPMGVDVAVLYPHLHNFPAHIVRRKGGRIKQDSADQTNEVLLLNPRYDYGAVGNFVKVV